MNHINGSIAALLLFCGLPPAARAADDGMRIIQIRSDRAGTVLFLDTGNLNRDEEQPSKSAVFEHRSPRKSIRPACVGDCVADQELLAIVDDEKSRNELAAAKAGFAWLPGTSQKQPA